jgi:hypothetical protein
MEKHPVIYNIYENEKGDKYKIGRASGRERVFQPV